MGLAAACALLLPAAAAPDESDSAIPHFMQGLEISWAGYLRGEKPSFEHAKTFAEWQPPWSGLGPITDDPQHPYYNDQVARETGLPSTYRVANLNNEAARCLGPLKR